MRAKVTSVFHGWDETQSKPQDFKVGDEVEGNIAWQAVQGGFAEWIVKPTDAEAHALRTSPASTYPARAPSETEEEEKARLEAEAKTKGKGKG